MKNISFLLLIFFVTGLCVNGQPGGGLVVKTESGLLEGTNESGVKVFKGIPYAAPPIGNFRWREPQPVQHWTGVHKAVKFGSRAMQLPIFGDMNFRSDSVSEDCLYLNVWTPFQKGNEELPVLVYFYGGGFLAGDGSEPRYDGESMARRGIVSVTVNYRLGVFGFLSLPELAAESPHHASGNYGLLDQSAALHWVKKNISAFGGDPEKITIAGESAGSSSVSALMASPLSRKLIAGAIGESGSLLGRNRITSREEAEKSGLSWVKSINKTSLPALRSMRAEDVLKATAGAGFGKFSVCVDGYFFPKASLEIYTAGEQAQVPLLVGWNSQEQAYQALLGADKPNLENYRKMMKRLYGDNAGEAQAVYHAADDDNVEQVVTDMASDRFTGYSTWKWSDLQSKTGGKPVYRYLYARPRPAMRAEMGNVKAGLAGGVIKDTGDKTPKAPPAKGAVHSAEIEYALGNLPTNRVYDWQPDDYRVAEIMQAYFANFIKSGNPNGLGLPHWPAVNANSSVQFMYIDTNTRAETERHRERYLFLEKIGNE